VGRCATLAALALCAAALPAFAQEPDRIFDKILRVWA